MPRKYKRKVQRRFTSRLVDDELLVDTVKAMQHGSLRQLARALDMDQSTVLRRLRRMGAEQVEDLEGGGRIWVLPEPPPPDEPCLTCMMLAAKCRALNTTGEKCCWDCFHVLMRDGHVVSTWTSPEDVAPLEI